MSLANLGVSLGKEEEVIGEYAFSYSIVLFFIKSKFYVTNKRFVAHIPNVILFVIPVGANTVTYPLKNIGAIRSRMKLRFFKLLIAAILVFSGLGLLTQSPLGLIMLLLGVVAGIESFPCLINVETSGAGGLWYQIAIWEKAAAQQLVNEVNQTIADM
jgi:hypothetical protein